MDIWHFFLSIGFIFALLGVIITIIVRKHKDKHRINNLQTNMNSLEKHFSTIKSEIELVTEKNLEMMESKYKEMSDILTIADNKCLYAQNLIEAIEKSTKLLKETNSLHNMPIIENEFDDKKFKDIIDKKISDFTEDINTKIDSLERRITYLSDRITTLEEKEINIDDSELLEIKKELKSISSSISERVTNEISNQLKGLNGDFSEIDDTEAISIDTNLNPNGNIEAPFTPKAIENSSSTTESESPIKNGITIEDGSEAFYPKGKELVVKEILEKYDQGISIPQIASEMKMHRTEISMIIKINKKINDFSKVGNYGN